MVKLTRNSYKRKIILFGVLIFTSIALISTGFAAWIMSANASKNKDGNITVGTVTDANLKIEDPLLTQDKFLFEPKESDNTGRVRNDGTNFESLTTTLTTKVSPTTYISSLVIKLQVPAGVYDASTDPFKYIVLPEGFENWTKSDDNKTYTGTKTLNITEVKKAGTYNLSEIIAFKWGKAFDGSNPGEYFDRSDIMNTVTDDKVKETLENLRACVYGYYNDLVKPGANRTEEIDKHKDDVAPKFTIIIEAKAD